MNNEPQSLVEAIRHFSDKDTCLDFMVSMRWPEGVVCPTCGRCQTDVVKIAKEVSNKLNTSRPAKVAIMGCEVNGPGEAREADIGIACGKNSAMLFKKGKMIKRIVGKNIVKEIKNALE